MPGFVGITPPGWMLHRAQHLGGVCLYARNVTGPDQLAALNQRLHEQNPGLVIGIDEEGGDVTRLEARAGSSYPGNLALGAVDDVALTRAVARSMGAELALAGVDLDLAPVADVNSNAANPVIGVRAFGAEPALVARQTAAWVEGLQASGVAACVKHFPGHGATSLDSHLALPAVDDDPHDGALEPFQAAFAAGARAVMSAHIVVRAVDSIPATVSRRIMTTVLRDELGFDGLAVSDGLEMRAISDGVGLADGAVLALAAGCDLLCIGGGLAGEDVVDLLRNAIVSAVPAHGVACRAAPPERPQSRGGNGVGAPRRARGRPGSSRVRRRGRPARVHYFPGGGRGALGPCRALARAWRDGRGA